MSRFSVLSFAVLLSTTLYSQARYAGLGLILGDPSGLSAKIWTGQKSAVDAALAWSFSGYDKRGLIRLHTDFLWHNWSMWVAGNKMLFCFGGGVMLGLGSDLALGIRAPGGASYLLEEAPVECFAEIAPLLYLLPGVRIDLDFALGARWYF